MNLEEQKNKLLKRLDALKLFPNNNEVRILHSRTQKALERIEKQIDYVKVIPEDKEIEKVAKRSGKLSRYWRYMRLIRNNFPDLKISDIRSQYTKRRRGEQVSIPQAVWDNASP